MTQKLGAIGAALLCMVAFAQPTAWGSVVLPPNYDSAKAYPLLIDLDDRLPGRYVDAAFGELEKLPPEKQFEAVQKLEQVINGTPEVQMGWLLEQMFPGGTTGKEFILARISPDGIPRDFRTADGLAKMLEGYERKVLAAHAALTASRKIDTARVYLTGFSIGGDLSWAIALRNPTKIRGAIVMSSRASYRATSYASLVSGKARFVFAIGSSDDASRIKGIKDAAALLKGQKIASLYCEIPKATHQAAPLAVFAEALGFMLAPSQPKTANALCRAP